MVETLRMYLQYPFVQYAFIVGTLIALCSSLFGVILVLKKYSFIGDGLSHVAFGAMCVAQVMHLSNEMLLVLPVTVVAAIVLLARKNSKIQGDAAIAMISVGALAFGYMIMNVFSVSSNVSGDVCATLFGSTSILTLTKNDVILCSALSIISVIIYIVLYKKLFSLTFDEEYTQTALPNANKYNVLIAIVIAVIIVLAMNLIGSLLVSCLIIFPTLTAMHLARNFKVATLLTVIFSVVCAITGIVIAIIYGFPVGSTIAILNIVVFAIGYIVSKIGG